MERVRGYIKFTHPVFVTSARHDGSLRRLSVLVIGSVDLGSRMKSRVIEKSSDVNCDKSDVLSLEIRLAWWREVEGNPVQIGDDCQFMTWQANHPYQFGYQRSYHVYRWTGEEHEMGI